MRIGPQDLSPPLLREIRDWARETGDVMLARECTIALSPSDHREDVVQLARQRATDGWNERIAAAQPPGFDDEPTITRVPTSETAPMQAQTIDEADQEWRRERGR